MKTKTTKIGSLLFILGVVILSNTFTLCRAQNIFTGKMKYTYYKKVKANNHKDTLTIASTKKHKKGNVKANDPIYMPVKSQDESTIPVVSLASAQTTEYVSMTTNTPQKLEDANQSVTKKSEPKETTKNKVKRIYNEKVNRFFGSKGSTMEYKNISCNIFLQILIVIAVIIIVYILIVCFFLILLDATGGFAIGC